MAHPAAPSHAPLHGTAPHDQAAEEHHHSLMPLWLTLATTVFLLGIVSDGQTRLTLTAIGFLGIAASVVGWIREDVKELSHKPFTPHGSEYLAGTIVLILSEVVIFGILFTYYFWSSAHTDPFVPDAVLEMDMGPIWINTALLISSGVTVELAKWRLKKDDTRGFRLWLGATVLLGLAFVGGQVLEYSHLMHEGLTPQTSVYGTAFYALTGVHGLHVVAGVIVLGLLLALNFRGFATKERLSGMEGAFLYWHFVDLIWVLVVTFVYLRVI